MVVMNQPQHSVMRSGTGQLANIDRVVFHTESLHTESLQSEVSRKRQHPAISLVLTNHCGITQGDGTRLVLRVGDMSRSKCSEVSGLFMTA